MTHSGPHIAVVAARAERIVAFVTVGISFSLAPLKKKKKIPHEHNFLYSNTVASEILSFVTSTYPGNPLPILVTRFSFPFSFSAAPPYREMYYH